MVRITECPRDAMQGILGFIPTDVKVAYLNRLLRVGFDRLDFGSFVSPKAIPQMRDTAEVLAQLDLAGTPTKLLAIIANVRGAQDAVQHAPVDILGFPFSVSETFQLRNTNSTREQSLDTVREIVSLCSDHGKIPLVYLSMGFGNPYGDEWSPEVVAEYAERLAGIGVRHFALADTVGSSTSDQIKTLFTYLKGRLGDMELGLHLHSTPDASRDKVKAALDAGCDRFDTALRGFGGCPMAADELTGNIATEVLLELCTAEGMDTGLDQSAWQEAMHYSNRVFHNSGV